MLQRCKIWGRTISFTLRYIEIRKHFLKYYSPPCASKSFCMIMCYHILHIVWKWLAGTRGGKDVQQPKNPGPKPIKCRYFWSSNFKNNVFIFQEHSKNYTQIQVNNLPFLYILTRYHYQKNSIYVKIQRSRIIRGTQIITNKRKTHLFDEIIHFPCSF